MSNSDFLVVPIIFLGNCQSDDDSDPEDEYVKVWIRTFNARQFKITVTLQRYKLTQNEYYEITYEKNDGAVNAPDDRTVRKTELTDCLIRHLLSEKITDLSDLETLRRKIYNFSADELKEYRGESNEDFDMCFRALCNRKQKKRRQIINALESLWNY